MSPILSFGDPRLREVCAPVAVFDADLGAQLDLLWKVLRRGKGGAALAAPQLGLLNRVVVMEYRGQRHEIVNPVIEEVRGEDLDHEGCLSLRGFVGRVLRAREIRVRFQDRYGETVVLERSGDLARCFQHEVDHLDGILYIDRLVDPYVFHQRTMETLGLDRLKALTGCRHEAAGVKDNDAV
jgi:peptide deformylase